MQETTNNLDAVIQEQYEPLEIARGLVSSKGSRSMQYSGYNLTDILMSIPFDKCQDMMIMLKNKALTQQSLVEQNVEMIHNYKNKD